MSAEGYGDGFSKVKLTCTCAKNKELDPPVKECHWQYEGETVEPEAMYCLGAPTSTTPDITSGTSTTGTTPGTTSGMDTSPDTTPGTTSGTGTTPDITSGTSTTGTTTTGTTTSPNTTMPTTVPTTTGTTGAGVDCTPSNDGTCGPAKAMETYLYVNFEGETITNNQVSLDPRLCHLDTIGNDAFVAGGNGITDFNNPKSQSVITRVDRCPSISSYSNPTENELGVPSAANFNCKKDYSWTYKGSSTLHNMIGMVATSPDKTYVLAAGVKEVTGNKHARWIIKLDAVTGQEIWSFEMPTGGTLGGTSKQSGFESIAFTKDGGFIAGGWGRHHSNGWPAFKSGGQVEFGTPIFQKFSKNVAKRTLAYGEGKSPTPLWTFECDATNCSSKVQGSMKTMRVFMDDGVEKVVSSPGTKNDVIIVNAADGTKSAFKEFDAEWPKSSFQDIVPVMKKNGKLLGFGVTGLDGTYTVPKGTGGCTKNAGCDSIFGHTALLSKDLTVTWKKTFNDFTGGTGAYANVTPLSDAVIITECWGLEPTYDSANNPTGLVAACGQGIEGCREYLTGINSATLNACEKDPRTTWRGAAVATDMNGNMSWYRNDGARAYEFVTRAENGQLTFLSDKPIGFGFATLAN